MGIGYIPPKDADGKRVLPTQNRFEESNIQGRLVRVSGQADAQGDITLSLKIPGNPGLTGRYAVRGAIYTNAYTWNDVLEKVELVDDDNILQLGAGAVIAPFHDLDVPIQNQGAPFEYIGGTEGKCVFENIGWYGEFPAGLYLKVKLKVAASAYVKGGMLWGKKV